MKAINLVCVLTGLACLALPISAGAQVATNPGVRWMRVPQGQHRICDADGDDCRWVPNQPAGYRRQCDADRDHCWWVANNRNWNSHYVCDADGDDCHWTSGYGQQYWRNHGGRDYGAPWAWYRAEPPAGYRLDHQRNWLVNRRRAAYDALQRSRAQGDRDAQQRLESDIDNLNSRIRSLDRRMSNR